MRKMIRLMALIMVFVFLSGACGTIDEGTPNTSGANNTGTDNTGNDNTGDVPDDNEYPEVAFQAEVIEAGDYLLVTPDKDSNEFKSSDRISVGLNETVIMNLDGEEISLKELKPGDFLAITYNGTIAESYPAQIGASEIKVTGHNLLIDGYLALIDDIWKDDDGLNSDIEMIALDTTGWIELSEIEKEIIFTQMKNTYGYEIIEGTFDELSEQGIIDKDILTFTNGVHITISNMKYDENKKITCSIKKWRGGDGAIGSDDVTAKYKDGEWKITKEGMWIS